MSFAVVSRPFSTDIYTGLAMPGGFFEVAFGSQNINAHISTDTAENNVEVYIESLSDPRILVVPTPYIMTAMVAGASRLLTWRGDFTNAPPGVHRISFIVRTPASRQRIIKKIFVTRVDLDQVAGGVPRQLSRRKNGHKV
jgi:hypothetical protein